jgi:hypothetical protein
MPEQLGVDHKSLLRGAEFLPNPTPESVAITDGFDNADHIKAVGAQLKTLEEKVGVMKADNASPREIAKVVDSSEVGKNVLGNLRNPLSNVLK